MKSAEVSDPLDLVVPYRFREPLAPAVAAERAGTTTLTIGAWVIGGVVALLGAFLYAELGSRTPRAGGGYVYIRDAFGRLPAFLSGWALLLAVSTGAIAALAITFANYLVALMAWPAGATVPIAAGAIGVLTVINILGVAPGAYTQNLFTILKLGPNGVRSEGGPELRSQKSL